MLFITQAVSRYVTKKWNTDCKIAYKISKTFISAVKISHQSGNSINSVTIHVRIMARNLRI